MPSALFLPSMPCADTGVRRGAPGELTCWGNSCLVCLAIWEPLEDTFECANRTSAPTASHRLATATPVSELWRRLAAKFLAASPSAQVLTCFCKFHFLIIHRAHCSMAWLYFCLRRRWHSPASSMEIKNGSHISGSFNPSKAEPTEPWRLLLNLEWYIFVIFRVCGGYSAYKKSPQIRVWRWPPWAISKVCSQKSASVLCLPNLIQWCCILGTEGGRRGGWVYAFYVSLCENSPSSSQPIFFFFSCRAVGTFIRVPASSYIYSSQTVAIHKIASVMQADSLNHWRKMV